MAKNKIMHIKYLDRGYMKKTRTTVLLISAGFFFLSFFLYNFNMIVEFFTILAAVYFFQQGRKIDKKIKDTVYISLDNFYIEFKNNMKFIFLGSENATRLYYKNIDSVTVADKAILVRSKGKRYMLPMTAISKENADLLINNLKKRVKVEEFKK
ncbi:MAG: hypothetical protein LBN09_02070 [Clostridioides sp.]|jgi:hypothetical protein|nr:hypothetical protein [Clostridioides sp.]